jgi:putative NADH-flavin reductase
MTVTIFGATGLMGSELITHALAKGWKVKVFGRNVESLIDKDLHSDENFKVIKGYVFDAGEVKHALAGSNLVLSALGGSFTGTDRSRSLGAKNIVAQMKALGIERVVSIGSRGVLQDSRGNFLMDSPDYPPELVPVSLEHKEAYFFFRESGLNWTLACPPTIVKRPADNNFITLAEKPTSGTEVGSGNQALFMIEEAERIAYPRQRVSICDL